MLRLRNACKVSVFHFIAVCFPRDPLMCAGLWWTMNVSDVEGESERGHSAHACVCVCAPVLVCVHTFFMLHSPHEWPFSAWCVLLVRLARSIRRRDTELGGLTGPSAIINYLQVLQNNNTKKCEPSISPPFTRNQYQYLMQCG